MIFVTLFLRLEALPGHIFEKLSRFDWLGATLFSVSSAGFLFGITTGGVMFAWYVRSLITETIPVHH